MDGLSKSKVDSCGVSSLRLRVNSALCVQCGKWIHCGCAGMKGLLKHFQVILHAKCEGNIGDSSAGRKVIYDEVETVREFTHLGDRVSAAEECKAAVTARTRCGWVKFRE